MLELPSSAVSRTWANYLAARDQVVAALRDHHEACFRSWETYQDDAEDSEPKAEAMRNLHRAERARQGEQTTHLLIGP